MVLSTVVLSRRTVGPVIRSKRLRAPSRRGLKRLAADPHVLLAMAVVSAALVVEMASRGYVLALVVPSLVIGLAILLAFSWGKVPD